MTDVRQQRGPDAPERPTAPLDGDAGPRTGVRATCAGTGGSGRVVRTAVVARPDQHAYRADPAVPAGHRGDPGLAAAAGEPERREGHSLLPAPSDARRRCWTRHRRVQRVRVGLVLRDLPAAVHLAGRLPAAAAARRTSTGDTPGAAGRAVAAAPAAGVGVGAGAWPARRPRSRRRLRTLLQARRYRTVVRPHDDGIGDGLRREGLPQGDRQPAVPLLAAGAADRRRVRVVVRLARRPAAGGRHRTRLLQHASRSTTTTASARGSTAATWSRSA